MEDVFFDRDDNEVVVGAVNSVTGLPETFAIKASGRIQSGHMTQIFYTVTDFERFLKVPVDIAYLTEIVSVTDSEGNEYYEVDYLSQDVIYRAVTNHNNNDQNNEVKSVLKPITVPRRFVTVREKDSTFLQFGTGDTSADTFNSDVADPSAVTLEMYGKNYISDKEFDPNNLIKSDKLGVVPTNTILKIIARANTSDNVNTGAGTITTVINGIFDFGDVRNLSNGTINTVKASLEVSNPEAVLGDTPLLTAEELKFRVFNTFGAQNRAVTEKDYEALLYNIPPQYGTVKRAAVVRDYDSLKRNLNIYVISENAAGLLTAPNAVLKQNIKTWLNKNKMINDTIDILDAKIVNLMINFRVESDVGADTHDVLRRCIAALTSEYSVCKHIGESFSISDVYTVLKKVDGVNDVKSVKVTQRNGTNYSDINFDVSRYMSADGRYIEAPKNVIFEVKYPRADIIGEIS